MKTFVLVALSGLMAVTSAMPNQKRAESSSTATATASSSSSSATPYDWRKGAVDQYPIHSSCNATERRQLRRALNETVDLAAHARDHILRHGNSSMFYQRYFGNASVAEPVGWFDKLVNGDKAGMLFRCDDVDGNCRLPGWGGHWRGSNATSETVICPLSYTTRNSLDALCGLGYTVANGALNKYWATDLVHRIFHLEGISYGVVDHYADSWNDCVALAKSDPAKAVRNTHSLQYFAIDVYAYDISLPGQGCTGQAPPVTTIAASPAQSTGSTKTSSAAQNCHTHEGGVLHCT